MQPLVEPGSFVWGFVSGAAVTFVGVMTWALCASAKMGDRAAGIEVHLDKPSGSVSVGGAPYNLDAEARSYEFTEYNVPDRDLPRAS